MVNGKQQFVSCENSMGVVQMSKGMLRPVSDNLRSETQILCAIAKTTLGNTSKVNWDHYATSYDDIRNLIEEFIPGFENYNKRVRVPGGFYLPNSARDGKFRTELYGDKMPFSITGLPKNKMAPDEYMMSSVRSHDQFNTTIYGLEDRYRGIHHERRVIFMNKDDIQKGGFKDGDRVDLFNYNDGIERTARLFIVVEYNIPKRCTITYYPETNVLIPISSVAEKSNTPTSKMILIKIKKHPG
jgi:anaerobic selenocysteine-containing dehydrogenase